MRPHACSTLSPPSPSPSPSRVRVSRDSNRERRVAASSVKITNRISTREERRALFKGSYNKKQNTNKNIRRTAIIVNEAAGGRGDSASDDMYSMDVMDDSSSNKSGVGTEIMKAEKNTPRTLLPGVPLLSEEDSWLTKLITLCIGAVSFYAAFLAINTKESAEITGAIVAQFIIEAFGRFLGLTPAPSPELLVAEESFAAVQTSIGFEGLSEAGARAIEPAIRRGVASTVGLAEDNVNITGYAESAAAQRRPTTRAASRRPPSSTTMCSSSRVPTRAARPLSLSW